MVWPCNSWPRRPIGCSLHCTASPAFFAAAFITLTASGTTSSPMSSPSNTPILSMAVTLPAGFSPQALYFGQYVRVEDALHLVQRRRRNPAVHDAMVERQPHRHPAVRADRAVMQ